MPAPAPEPEPEARTQFISHEDMFGAAQQVAAAVAANSKPEPVEDEASPATEFLGRDELLAFSKPPPAPPGARGGDPDDEGATTVFSRDTFSKL